MIITLASASPRRRELLGALYRLRVAPVEVDERPLPDEEAVAYARRVAIAKCVGEGLVVSADTVVHLEGRIYGKPRDPQQARAFLAELSGRVHQVTTGTCVRRGEQRRVRAVSTDVQFRVLSEGEIARYVATGEPMDKAGAYGIQGLGGFLVASIRGSYSNVVGLPLAEVIEDLQALGAPPPMEEL